MTKSLKDSAPPLKIEAGKEYIQRDGRRYRVYATDGAGYWAVHGAVLENGQWMLSPRSADGGYTSPTESGRDLVALAPRKIKVDQRFVLIEGKNGTGDLYDPDEIHSNAWKPGDYWRGKRIIGYQTITLEVEVYDQ